MYSFNTLSELKRNVLQLEKLHTRNVWFYDNQSSHTIYSPRLIEEECWLLEQFPHYEENEATRTVGGHPRSPQRSHSEESFLEVDLRSRKPLLLYLALMVVSMYLVLPSGVWSEATPT